MAKQRASIFDSDAALDLQDFKPKTSIDATAPQPEQVKTVAQAAHYRSREPVSTKLEAQFKRHPRQYRTGRNVQFAAKVSKETAETIYAIADAQGWVLGYTLQRALEALQRELEGQK